MNIHDFGDYQLSFNVEMAPNNDELCVKQIGQKTAVNTEVIGATPQNEAYFGAQNRGNRISTTTNTIRVSSTAHGSY